MIPERNYRVIPRDDGRWSVVRVPGHVVTICDTQEQAIRVKRDHEELDDAQSWASRMGSRDGGW